MDKYDIIGSLGEGSFGRVYKAKRISDNIFVALKVISKRGRSPKELKGFRRECEIQRKLDHPNVIHMLDSFETDNEIVVITEFAHKELNKVLSKVGYLPESKVQEITWDLLSALYYLHSNRVLHRDLKPQNILLDAKNCVKLCDFGFARNMSLGTHVLTSIKGTPLYMAPELIEEQPYDFKADLWSLGCIIYELLVGAPPFRTINILQLIRLIKHEQVQWPTRISDVCTSFLKGLLQKNPAKRMGWEQILNHPFVKGHVYFSKTMANSPFTRPPSPKSHELKEKQKIDIISKKGKCETSKVTETVENPDTKVDDKQNNNENVEPPPTVLKEASPPTNENVNVSQTSTNSSKICGSIFIEDNHPMETEEWIVFLQKSIQEVLSGEMTSLTQANLAGILISPLRNTNSSPKVLTYIAKLLSIPFVIRDTSEDVFAQIHKVYLEIKLIPNLIYASKLLLRNHREDTPCTNSPTPSNSPLPQALESYKSLSELTNEDYQALEYIYLLISHLVYSDEEFLLHFCDSVVVLNVYILLKLMLLDVKKHIRIVLDVMAILTHLLRKLPENQEIIEKILLNESNHADVKPICFVDFLRHSDSLLRERTCYFLLFLSKNVQESTIKTFWNEKIRETLEALMFDSIDTVRNAAEVTVEDLKQKSYYNIIME